MKPELTPYNGPDAPKFENVILTQKLVDYLLEINTRNRRPSANNIAYFEDIIDRNAWSVGNALIKVNSSWTWLIDGQHHLMALKNKGYPFAAATIAIISDQHSETVFQNQDIGNIRKVSTVLQLEGQLNSILITSIENAYMKNRHNANHKSSAASVHEFIKKHGEFINRIRIGKCGWRNSSAIAAVLIYCEKYPENTDEVLRFWECTKNGEGLTGVMYRFHNFMASPMKGKNDLQILTIVFKCIKYYINRMDMNLLRIENKDVEEQSEEFSLTRKHIRVRA